jgi:hypothetical protein
MSYNDPDNLLEISLKIKNSATIGDVKKLMDSIFPRLFITSSPSFCDDYPHLNENWNKLCSSINTSPKQILIFDNYSDDCTLVKTFAECFTTAGFAVRRKCEFIPCEKCGKSIPAPAIYNLFKEKNFTVPEIWSKLCKSCV